MIETIILNTQVIILNEAKQVSFIHRNMWSKRLITYPKQNLKSKSDSIYIVSELSKVIFYFFVIYLS